MRRDRRRDRDGCSTSATSTGARSSASRASASTRWPTTTPTRRRRDWAVASTSTRRCARWPRFSQATFTLTIDGEPESFTGWSVAAANARTYGGGMVVAPDADLNDGRLDVVLIRGSSRAALPAHAAQGVQGSPRRKPDGRRRARRARSTSPPTTRSPSTPTATRSPVTPCTVRAIPDAIRVLLPA